MALLVLAPAMIFSYDLPFDHPPEPAYGEIRPDPDGGVLSNL